jgi:hypothetical protein
MQEIMIYSLIDSHMSRLMPHGRGLDNSLIALKSAGSRWTLGLLLLDLRRSSFVL